MSEQIAKMAIIQTIDYEELKIILDAIEKLGYKIVFVDNGNILIETRKEAGEKKNEQS